MKVMRWFSFAAALFLSTTAFAEIKKCEELKGEIEKKLQDKGVSAFTLEIVPADQVKDQKVVGSCDGGKNKITYSKQAPSKDEANAPKKQ